MEEHMLYGLLRAQCILRAYHSVLLEAFFMRYTKLIDCEVSSNVKL